MVPIAERSNEEWLAALRGPGKEAAFAELRGLLVRGLRAALHGRTGGADPSAEAMPLVQKHLHMCGECRDEFEALLTALRATGEA